MKIPVAGDASLHAGPQLTQHRGANTNPIPRASRAVHALHDLGIAADKLLRDASVEEVAHYPAAPSCI